MDRLIFHNQQIVEATGATVAATLAGVQYGWEFLQRCALMKTESLLLKSIGSACSDMQEKARVPVLISKDETKRAINELIQANALINGRIRLTILKGIAGSWRTQQERDSEVLIFTSSEQTSKTHEVNLTISPYRLLSSNPLAGVKRTAMLENLLAYEEARNRNFDEAVMLNERGEIVSGTAGNIFWVEGIELCTPSLGTGCIAGITRAYVLEIARRINIHVVEASFPLPRLLDASEVFLTSTARGITPVKSYDFKTYDDKLANMTRNISRQFKKLTDDGKIDK